MLIAIVLSAVAVAGVIGLGVWLNRDSACPWYDDEFGTYR